jgi:hypothetical protein
MLEEDPEGEGAHRELSKKEMVEMLQEADVLMKELKKVEKKMIQL